MTDGADRGRAIKTVDVRIRSPATIIISGPTGSGKTRLLMDLIAAAETIATPAPTEIVYCYDVWQNEFDELDKRQRSDEVGELSIPVRMFRGLPDVRVEFGDDPSVNRWLIVDDLMKEVTEDKNSDKLFTKYSHHLNITVFLVVQNLFLKSLRTISINTHYFFLGKNPRDGLSAGNLAKQMFPGDSAYFMETYKDATSEPHSFLFVSARQETDDAVRLVKNYGRPDKTMYAYVKKNGA
jgi:energy-coupling factor transporter ATP-binding protein EcfA2